MRKIVQEAQILEYISCNLEVSLTSLREVFPVSVPTLNRLLAILKRNNWIKIEKDKVIYSPITYFSSYSMKDIGAKMNLARGALSLIEDGDTIGLAGGSTTVSLMMPFLLLNKKNITVVSNSLLALKYYLDLEYLAKENNISFIALGGMIQSHEYVFETDYAETVTANYRIDKTFMTTSGADVDRGLFGDSPKEFSIEKHLMKVSGKNYLLCTKDKFNKKHLYKWADWANFSGLITDYQVANLPLSCENIFCPGAQPH